MKGLKTWGIIVSVMLVAFSVLYPVPEKHMHVSSSYSAYDNTWADNEGAEYIGGDAYNYEIEASLKAGYVSGVLAMKCITFVGGMLLYFLTLFSSAKSEQMEAQASLLADLKENEREQIRVLKQLSEQLDRLAMSSHDNEQKSKEQPVGKESVEQLEG